MRKNGTLENKHVYPYSPSIGLIIEESSWFFIAGLERKIHSPPPLDNFQELDKWVPYVINIDANEARSCRDVANNVSNKFSIMDRNLSLSYSKGLTTQHQIASNNRNIFTQFIFKDLLQ